MSTLTKNVVLKFHDRAGRKSYVVSNGVTIYAGALVGINAAGYLAKWADTAGHTFVGVLLDKAIGDTSATPPVEGRVDQSGITIKDATVASVARTDENALVYCATDNPADFTLTPGTNVRAVGWVSRFISTGIADVTLFTPEEYLCQTRLAGVAALTDNSGGAAADGTIGAIAAAAGACAGGATPSAAQVDTAIATAVATIVTGANAAVKELATKVNEIIAR